MTFVVAYDVATSYGERPLEVRITDTDTDTDTEIEIESIFARAARAWFGEQLAPGEPIWSPACEPGYALVAAGPSVVEYFESAALRDALARDPQAIAMRVLRRKPDAEPPWSPEARVLRDLSVARADDDDARLVLADALEGKRGALVVVQCDLARDTGLTPEESRSRRRAQRKMLARDGVAWSRLRGLATRCTFRRGFVEAIELDARIDRERVRDAAPHVQSLTITATNLPAFALAASAARGVRGLYVACSGTASVTLVHDGALADLRAFGTNGLSPEGAHALVAHGGLANLDVLRLDDHALGPDALAALVRTSRTLRVLDIASDRAPLAIIGAIPWSVRELHVGGTSAALISSVSEGPFAPALEKLAVHGGHMVNPYPLGRFKQLRSLDLLDCRITAGMARVPLPALRELRLAKVTVAQIRAIATAFGPQLELLDLRGAPNEVGAIARELRELVVGDVWIGPPGRRRPLMPASYAPFEPMWDVGNVELG